MKEMWALMRTKPGPAIVLLVVIALIAVLGISGFLTIARTGALLPIVLASLAGAIGLSSNLTFSMARAREKAESAAFDSLNVMASQLVGCTLRVLQAAVVSIVAVPLSVHWKTSTLASIFFGSGVSLWEQVQLGIGFVALLYAAMTTGAACLGAAMLFPFLIAFALHSDAPEKRVTPELLATMRRWWWFGRAIGADMPDISLLQMPVPRQTAATDIEPPPDDDSVS